MSNIEYKEIHFESIKYLIASDIILLVTATNLETKELHKKITPLNSFDKILQVYNESLTFYLGNFGKYKIAHIQCGMGSISRESSIITVTGILQIIKADAVIMPGIAFGINDKKQKIGDVLVAEAIQPYNNKRVSSDNQIQRAYAMPSNKTLLNRFKNIKNWHFPLSDNLISEVNYGLVLSGEELIDNREYRDELVGKYNTALGGEMEGAGVYAACDGRSPCILVKGICDFADGNKSEDKEARQTIAVQAAIDLSFQLFNSDIAFLEFGIKPFGSESESKTFIATSSFKDVLFDVYDSSKETYYIERDIDKEFQNNILHLGAWVYGISGSGKSTLISRNLSILGINYIQINLALCFGQDVEAMFYEIYVELVTKLENSSKVLKFESLILTLKQISSILKKHFSGKKYVVFIEEIPLDDKGHKEFAKALYSLLISNTSHTGLENIRFILSSIDDPTPSVQPFNQKVYTLMKFVKLENWSQEDCSKLIDLIITHCDILLSEPIKLHLLKTSEGSPRFIKKFFRNLIFQNNFSESKIMATIMDTKTELFLN